MKSLVVVLVLLVAFVAVPTFSSTAVAQFDRDGCLRSCESLKPIGRGMGAWGAYQRCVADCERQFWDEFDEKVRDAERKRDED
jgi:hypothetical protein